MNNIFFLPYTGEIREVISQSAVNSAVNPNLSFSNISSPDCHEENKRKVTHLTGGQELEKSIDFSPFKMIGELQKKIQFLEKIVRSDKIQLRQQKIIIKKQNKILQSKENITALRNLNGNSKEINLENGNFRPTEKRLREPDNLLPSQNPSKKIRLNFPSNHSHIPV